MTKEGIKESNGNLTLYLKNGKSSIEKIENIKNVYCLLIGSDVQANDSACFLLVFEKDMWIIPEDSKDGIILRKIIKSEFKDEQIVIAYIDYLPFNWRKNRFLLGMEARLAIKEKSSLAEVSKFFSRVENVNFSEIY